MRIDRLKIQQFKNLQDFFVDFDEKQLTTVLIGHNGTGKSNLIEALVIIFRDLDLGNRPEFPYELAYHCRGHEVSITSPSDKSKQMRVSIDGQEISHARFADNRDQYLPSHVFAYYSGPTNRLEFHFDAHQNRFYDALLRGDEKPLRPLFYARLIHSQFVLLSYFSYPDESSKRFLDEQLGITGLESVLFVLRKPTWAKTTSKAAQKLGDPRFWFARGVVKDFLDHLYEASLAPISATERVLLDFRKQSTREEHLYLFVADEQALVRLASKYGNNREFFKQLESTYISDLIAEVRIRVMKKDVEGDITFRELSEGEQQLLTVLGLMKFTSDEESLFLLDEPDTHLNPIWAYNYLHLIEQVANLRENSQLIIATHDPLMICGLSRSQVQIFQRQNDRIIARPPDEDPRGMGVAGVLTSELFGLQSTLDLQTLEKLQKRQELFAKRTRKPEEEDEMMKLSDELAQLGFARTIRDPLYEKFVKAVSEHPLFRKPVLTPEELRTQNKIATEVIAEILEEENQ